ncbi:head-tail adaptor protein [Blastochloris tepida]|uniref:Head-tail adaptor protein n=1 Tax=Blastochloris tepida TaxID=2233851 RepID=A0A348G1E4_9HYPH|nr:head-tail adaptor protein [Blastochloris tepida]BBF93377.1 head-tail adaptor protein [Blastochloris tepida]
MLAAGSLRDRLRFERRQPADDGFGNVAGDWVARCTAFAARKALRGGEAVMGQRLAGRQPIVFTVRASSETREIAPDWRAVDVRTGTVYAVRSVVDPDGRGERLDILCEGGVAP